MVEGKEEVAKNKNSKSQIQVDEALKEIRDAMNSDTSSCDDEILELTDVVGSNDLDDQQKNDSNAVNLSDSQKSEIKEEFDIIGQKRSAISNQIVKVMTNSLNNYINKSIMRNNFENNDGAKIHKFILDVSGPKIAEWISKNIPNILKESVDDEIKKIFLK